MTNAAIEVESVHRNEWIMTLASLPFLLTLAPKLRVVLDAVRADADDTVVAEALEELEGQVERVLRA